MGRAAPTDQPARHQAVARWETLRDTGRPPPTGRPCAARILGRHLRPTDRLAHFQVRNPKGCRTKRSSRSKSVLKLYGCVPFAVLHKKNHRWYDKRNPCTRRTSRSRVPPHVALGSRVRFGVRPPRGRRGPDRRPCGGLLGWRQSLLFGHRQGLLGSRQRTILQAEYFTVARRPDGTVDDSPPGCSTRHLGMVRML